MSKWESYDVVRQVRGNGLLMGVSFQSPVEDEEHMWYARAIRSRMLANGVWAISDSEDNIRMYPALNMADETLLDGLDIMEEAIAHVNEHGQDVGDSPMFPTGL